MKASNEKLQALLTGGIGSKAEDTTCASRIILRDSNLFRDLNSRDFDVLGVAMNCYHAMGVGVLRTLAERYPDFAASDKETPKGNESKLGNIVTSTTDKGIALVAMYVQYGYGNYKPANHYSAYTGHINLKHLESTLREMLNKFPNKRIAIAQPGVGNNGTALDKILPTIEAVLEETGRTLILYKSNPNPNRRKSGPKPKKQN